MKNEEFIGILESVFAGRQKSPTDCIGRVTHRKILIEDVKGEDKLRIVFKGLTKKRIRVQTGFLIVNKPDNEIVVWSFDTCFQNAAGGQCDGICFCPGWLGFIELKMDATSDSLMTIDGNLSKAVGQIEASVAIMKESFQRLHTEWPIKDQKLEAFICTPRFYPKTTSSLNKAALSFFMKNRIRLYHSSEKNFGT